MTTEKPISMKKAYAIAVCFFLMGVFMIFLPIHGFSNMFGDIRADANLITFDMGVYYLFGGGLSFIVMVIGLVYPKITNRPLSRSVDKILVTLFVSGIVLIFLLPFSMHVFIDEHMTSSGYVICEGKSSQWLHVRTIVYTRPEQCH